MKLKPYKKYKQPAPSYFCDDVTVIDSLIHKSLLSMFNTQYAILNIHYAIYSVALILLVMLFFPLDQKDFPSFFTYDITILLKEVPHIWLERFTPI